jgi:hypothetical protein
MENQRNKRQASAWNLDFAPPSKATINNGLL